WKAKHPLTYVQPPDALIKPQYVIDRIYQFTKDKDPIVSTDVGQHQMWAAQHFVLNKPHRWLTSGGLGTMGFGMPAALGAQAGFGRRKWAKWTASSRRRSRPTSRSSWTSRWTPTRTATR